MPYVNPIVEGMKVCRRGHHYPPAQSHCPECRKLFVRSYQRKRYVEIKSFIDGLKEHRACARCGFRDPRALVWHHRDPVDKNFEISKWTTRGRSLGKDRLLEEMEKCDLICANCHLIEHSRPSRETGRLKPGMRSEQT